LFKYVVPASIIIVILCLSLIFTACGSSVEKDLNNEAMETIILTDNVETDNVIKVNVNEPGIRISPTLYGAFFEDINSAADGGIYAELIKNRSFEFASNLDGWSTVKKGKGEGNVTVERTSSLNENNLHYVRIKVEQPGEGVGVANTGYGGIAVIKGKKYNFSIYARSITNDINKLYITIEDSNGNIYGEAHIDGISKEWKNFNAVILVNETNERARLVITSREKGAVDIDMVSLFPQNTWKNRENGLRYDLSKLINDMRPAFLRFPGGCFVEGNSMANAYRWKNTIGDISVRPTTYNLWGYYTSNGLGFYEFFQFCEDIGAEPVPVINCGMSCQARGGNFASLSDLDEYIQDALDLIEYANGPVDSKWGAVRKQHGHPKPFNLKYLAIGNEQWGEAYFQRYEKFYDAIKEKYPDINIIFSAGPHASGPLFHSAWEWVKKTGKADIVDEHFYMPPEWFFNNVDRYDDYDRNGPKVFIGEYAAHTPSRRNNMEAALAEAAFLMGVERNSDIVVMASYAPLLGKVGASQWQPNLIWFNNVSLYGTPSYYVQKMFSENRGDFILPLELSVLKKEDEKSIKGMVGLGSWATQVEYKDFKVIGEDGRVIFSDDFSGDKFNWRVVNGNWRIGNGALRQISRDVNCYAITGDTKWENYTISLKARKIGGNEGMLILFGVKNDNTFYWWNIGGWGNTSTAIEKSVAGSKMVITDHSDITVVSGKWYDIKIELSGERIKCYLDGKLIHDVIDRTDYDDLYVVSSIDKNGDIILKVVNASDNNQNVKVILDGVQNVMHEGTATILSAESKSDENDFLNPRRVYPVTKKVKGLKKTFNFEFDSNSVTVLRIKTKK
jgi:alpha-L-arabinofuranosidase